MTLHSTSHTTKHVWAKNRQATGMPYVIIGFHTISLTTTEQGNQ